MCLHINVAEYQLIKGKYMTRHLMNFRADYKKQNGATLLGMLIVGALVVFVAIVGMKIVPAYLEFMSVKKVLRTMHQEPLATMSSKEIKDAFNRKASMDYITVVNGSDLSIDKSDSGGVAVSVDYQVVKPVMGNVSVLIDFSASSDGK
jgi:hypothetical protein